jgi:hypothetical protein
MVAATISVTESDVLTALRSFLLNILPAGVDVIKAQVNRVPEPAGEDFVVMTPMSQDRLGTNETMYFDNIFVGSISATLLTVVSVQQIEGNGLEPGMLLIDGLFPTMNIQPNTQIVEQLTGSPSGGVGTYSVSVSQTLAQETLYAGLRADLVPTDACVQLDIHGPNSGNNTKVIEGLFRSDFGVDQIATSGYDLTPLYCGDPRQSPFINAEQQYEYRWVMDAHFQINPVIGTPQQFLDEIEVPIIVVDTLPL